jgi:hypothetical protein
MKLLYLNHCTSCGHRAQAVAPLGRCPRCSKPLRVPSAGARGAANAVILWCKDDPPAMNVSKGYASRSPGLRICPDTGGRTAPEAVRLRKGSSMEYANPNKISPVSARRMYRTYAACEWAMQRAQDEDRRVDQWNIEHAKTRSTTRTLLYCRKMP